jgi:hypothetical protein
MDVSLSDWARDTRVEDTLFWKGTAHNQVEFVLKELGPFAAGIHDYALAEESLRVISTHRSKSVDLPVYRIINMELDMEFILRNNFYNWKFSVISSKPILAEFTGLFYTSPPVEPDYTGDHLAPVYFEGFPEKYIFGYYDKSDNKKKWSADMYNDYDLWTTIYVCLRALGGIKPLVYHTRKSHAAELRPAYKAGWANETK